jgi:hypothetical protein
MRRNLWAVRYLTLWPTDRDGATDEPAWRTKLRARVSEEGTLSDAPMCKGIKPPFLLKRLFELAGTPAKGARWRE